MLFLAALGLNAGPALVDLLLRPEGWKAAILATIIVVVCCAAQAIAGRYLGLSAPRTAGAVAGFLGQPAVLQAADARVADERDTVRLRDHRQNFLGAIYLDTVSKGVTHGNTRFCSGITSARGALHAVAFGLHSCRLTRP